MATNLSHLDYTIAWICALPLEVSAALMVLDAIHPNLSQPLTDPNSYTLGRVSGRNVVVVSLPSGTYGTISAAVMVSHMQSTFPSVRVALMVGIGGGVPSPQIDIRLGDVVVSKPTSRFGGVIQYDFGKATTGGEMEQIGMLNKPPQALLTAVSRLEASPLGRRTRLSEVVSAALASTSGQSLDMKSPLMFGRPDSDDILFKAGYPHHRSEEASCEHCDRNQLVQREERRATGPEVHYGLIASGNQVMKDAVARDRISKAHGILCFEMEAAGIMDQMPCLVIRGICDYCDSHKNKIWQGYAALMAAAYSKVLLSFVATYKAQEPCHMAKPGYWMVPFNSNPRFFGRTAELDYVKNGLFGGSPQDLTNPRIAITGLGGVGKTQIALKLAYYVQETYPQCSVFWVPSNSPESLERAYLMIAQMLGIEEVKADEAILRVQSHLSQPQMGPWMLIFDNLDDLDMWNGRSSGALKTLLPESRHGHILVTTRNQKIAVKVASSNVLKVQEMDEDEALGMFQRLLVTPQLVLDDHGTAIELLRQITFLPLAITQAAAYINENGLPLTNYLALLKEQESDVVELLSEDFEDQGRYANVQNPIAMTWLISFQQVKRLNPLAMEYLSFMACVEPQDIPDSLLPTATLKQKTDALGLLRAYSFISTHGMELPITLHRLVHLAMRNWLRKESRWTEAVDMTLLRLYDTFPGNDPKNRPMWRSYLPHVQALIREVHRTVENQHEGKYIRLLENVGQCLFSDGRFEPAKLLFTEAYDLRRKKQGQNDKNTLSDQAWIVRILNGQGNSKEAETLCSNVLEKRKELLGPQHPDTQASISDLILILWQLGQRDRSYQLELELLELQQSTLGDEHPDTLHTMSSIAATYRNGGKWVDAEKLEARVVAARKRILGEDHPDTLTSMARLASIFNEQARFKDAEELTARVLETRTTVLGSEHLDTLDSMYNLALILRNQGRFQEAEALQVQELAGASNALGPEHPDVLVSMSQLAWTMDDLGRYIDSEVLYTQVAEVRLRTLGLEHPSTLTCIGNHAVTVSKLGRWREAEEMDRKVLEIRERVLGPEHHQTLASMGNIALTLQYMGRWQEAEEIEQKLVEIRRRVLGAEHPSTLKSLCNLAKLHSLQGEWDKAEALVVEVVRLRTKILGPTHVSTLVSQGVLAQVLAGTGRLADAETLNAEAVNHLSVTMGPEYPETMASKADLVCIYAKQGKWAEAVDLGEWVLESRRRILGPEHPATIISMAHLARVMRGMGRNVTAGILMQQSIPLHHKVLGTTHPDTVACLALYEEWDQDFHPVGGR